MTERRAGGQLRAEARRLSGVVLRYGDVSPSHNERFEPGALSIAGPVPLNLQHDPMRAVAWSPGGGLELHPDRDALRMTAELPPIPAADAALSMVREGLASGLSVEFRAERERVEAGIRVVERAVLMGVGLVRKPSYQSSRVEARARSGRTLGASIPVDEALVCECIAQGRGGAECVALVTFKQEALDVMAATINDAYDQARREIAGPDVLAVFKDYSRPLASARRGTLRAEAGDVDQGLIVTVDVPTGSAGDAVQAASETAGVIARPLIDYERSEYQDTPQGRIVTRPFLRAILVGSTDAREGWPDAVIDYAPPEEDALPALPPPRRRAQHGQALGWL